MAAVCLNLANAEAVRAAALSLAPLKCDFLVEKMVQGGVAELIIGIARDPQFGLYLTIGAGGVMVELWNDTRSLLLPASRDEIREALLTLRSAPFSPAFAAGQKPISKPPSRPRGWLATMRSNRQGNLRNSTSTRSLSQRTMQSPSMP